MSPSATPQNAEEYGDSSRRAAHGAAVKPLQGTIDPDLALVIDAWPTLPEPIKAGILAVIRAAK